MSRYLLVDVGAGTQDVLWYDDEADLHYKAVVSSPVRTVARRAAATEGPLVVLGGEMGGGPITRVLEERAREHRVAITAAAARTVHHDPDRVRARGLDIVSDDEANALACCATVLHLGDVEPERLRAIVESFGVPFAVDVAVFCAQDHGVPPPGESHLTFRRRCFVERLERRPRPEAMLLAADEVEPTWNRLATAAADLRRTLPEAAVYVMASGLAAVLGARFDPFCADRPTAAVLDVATSHTVGAVFAGADLAGWFEVHTHDLDVDELDELLPALVAGQVDHEAVVAGGGHGAWCRQAVGAVDFVVATGPRRHLVAKSRLPMIWGAPLGDNMMTGTTGLLAAVRHRQGLPPPPFR